MCIFNLPRKSNHRFISISLEKELSKEILNWWPKRYMQEEQALEKLSCYGIYNKETESGFFTYE